MHMRSRQFARLSVSAGLLILTIGIAATGYAVGRRVLVGVQQDGSIVVPNGQTLTPTGTHIEVNDRPLGMVVSPNGSLLAVVTGSNFRPRALHIIDLNTRTLKQTIAIANSFVGVAFSPAGDTIYVGGGASNDVKIFKSDANGVFAANGTIPVSGGAEPSGLSLNPAGTRLFVALNQTHQVAVIDTATRQILTRVPVGVFPYTTVGSADGSKVYVSNWGGKVPGPTDFTDGQFPVVVDRRTGIPVSGTVSVIDAASNTVAKTIEVGLHPNGMALSPRGDRVYVTNANSDTVSVIDTATDAVVKTLHVGEVGRGRTPILGSSPNAVTVSPNGRTLYVANAAENAIAVVDVGRREDDAVRGLIPTGWYPTAVALDATGQQLFVASGYGFGSIAPLPAGRTGRSFADRVGVVSLLNIPDERQLERFTAQVRRNNSFPARDGEDRGGDDDRQGSGGDRSGDGQGEDDNRGNQPDPIPMHAGQGSPIKHVFYIIRENRTYDQVFGDQPQGNGDPTLVQFGRDVTPNAHALTDQFALLDNYYGPGDQSALGHRWCLQAYPSVWVHKYGNARNNQSPMLLGPTDAIYDQAQARRSEEHTS